MREIVLDTETTGFDPLNGDKIVEVGCVELVDRIPTGRTFQRYVNPERAMSAGASAVTGIKDSDLVGQPIFGEIAADLMAFIGDGTLVIHNAEFDVKFLNAELGPYGYKPFDLKSVVDTLQIARMKFPGSPASLDALCKRFGVDNGSRTLHGALLDAELLTEVYIELMGGRQRALVLEEDVVPGSDVALNLMPSAPTGDIRPPRHFPVTEQELEAHAGMVKGLKNPLWTMS
ncbi:MAG: DNA polymerase III subunit epsilon [Pseudomonadota bacterium]